MRCAACLLFLFIYGLDWVVISGCLARFCECKSIIISWGLICGLSVTCFGKEKLSLAGLKAELTTFSFELFFKVTLD